jgi:hypothetical protein
MKRTFTFLLMSLLATSLFAQLGRVIDFEEGLADTAWHGFGNQSPDTIPPVFEVIANPLTDGINTSDSVLASYSMDTYVRWWGGWCDYNVLTTFLPEAYTLGMMVHKEVISPTKLKVEKSLNEGSDYTIEAVNTVTDEWELLTYEFPDAVGYLYQRLTIFPDFPAEGTPSTSTVLMDNISAITPENTTVQKSNGNTLQLYPTPAEYRMAVSYPGLSEIIVYDLMGKQVRNLKFSPRDSKVIETGDLKPGIYLLTAVSGNERITLQFMKK